MVHAQPVQGGPPPARGGRPKRPMWHWLLLAGVAAVGLLVVGAMVRPTIPAAPASAGSDCSARSPASAE